ncbi:MAG: hypothetical protein ACSHWS_06270 [Sulfitobacter sp.]
MTVSLILIFLVFFIGGPLIFRVLTKDLPTLQRMKLLGMLTTGFAIAGLFIRFAMPGLWGQNLWITVAGVTLVWFAWIGVLAFAAMALRRNDPSAQMRRWSTIIGALGTTMPWFGLVSATMMQG